jgi:acylphosphatase
MRQSVHAIVTGRVQGVGFRAFVASEARLLKLDGWVRNRRDGTVEAVFAGADHDIQQLLTGLNAGPPAAAVYEVRVEPHAEPVPEGFASLPTV